MEGLRHVHPTALSPTLSPSRPYGSVTAGVHGCPRCVAPSKHSRTLREHHVVAHGRRNAPSAAPFLVM